MTMSKTLQENNEWQQTIFAGHRNRKLERMMDDDDVVKQRRVEGLNLKNGWIDDSEEYTRFDTEK